LPWLRLSACGGNAQLLTTDIFMARITKRDAILKTADALFMRDGFGHVTMDQIAAAVPVSKPTLYHHFEDKAHLFRAIINKRCEAVTQGLPAVFEERDARKGLARMGERFLSMVTSEGAIRTHRHIVSEQNVFEGIGKQFHENGPERIRKVVADYFTLLGKRGYAVDDADLLADMFISSIKGYMHLQLMLGISRAPSAKAIKARVQKVVMLFMRMIETRQGPS
jgi:TetR/AcrR family transcriptional repressor of mexJK operon